MAFQSQSPSLRSYISSELDRLASLGENWDAQGAHRIDRAIVAAARRFAEKLPDGVIAQPAVVPMAKGNLQFEWHDGPRSLELEFESPTELHYLKWHPEEGVEEEGVIGLDDMDRAMALVLWFVRGLADD